LSEHILYIEDDEAQSRLVQRCLERAGYAVQTVPDGQSALALFGARVFDAIVVDQTLPDISGLEVVQKMRLRGPLPPTIMVTGTGDERIAVAAMKAGASDYLVKDMEGSYIHVLPLVIRRALDHRRMLLEKQQIEQDLAQAERLRTIGQLAAGIAHEINTPTQYLGDNARFLKDAFHDIGRLLDDFEGLLKAAREGTVNDAMIAEAEKNLRSADLDYLRAEIPLAIQQSLEGVDYVAGIVRAMKEYSHPGTGQKQVVDLNHIIEGAITLSSNECKYVADVTTDLDPDLPPIPCMPSDINRVVLNLIVNAAHAIEEARSKNGGAKGTITVRTRRNGPWAEILVEDTGVGIPPHGRSRVFDYFFTTKEVGRGTGQGLAIARAIVVDKHGGTIHFETEVGRGTTFIVRLPIEERPDPRDEHFSHHVPLSHHASV